MPRTAVALIVVLLSAVVAVGPAGGQSEGNLRDRIGSGKAQERALASAAARLGQLERKVSREVAVLEGRLSEAQSELDAADARLASTQTRLDEARRRVVRLRKRLAEVRSKLSGLLRERYMGGSPDLMTVVLHADGFPQLLETLQFVRRVELADTRLLDLVRAARSDADHERTVLFDLTKKRDQEADAARTRRDALASITQGLRDRQAFLARAHAARLAALSRVRSNRRKAERELTSLLAARARAAVSNVGPGGPWAIPWAIVQCESGGQNLPPNYAGASGYYQFMVATWRGLGGSTPQAYQASKAEQDRLAAKLWAGGAGRDNWVCASLVDA
ncbi:transglycosylase family protein [Solirubrobacter soli]|uniref:transglycosylase family protein n=1 Tax=Solirubrobacter soli TaxID=363832 RepID=UPI0003FE4814|nr:transglycosylase family protein [Solirubrobacter soli]